MSPSAVIVSESMHLNPANHLEMLRIPFRTNVCPNDQWKTEWKQTRVVVATGENVPFLRLFAKV